MSIQRYQKAKWGQKTQSSRNSRSARAYSPTTSYKNIYLITKERLDYWPSKKKRQGNEKNFEGAYCQYHRTNGHKTNQCRATKGMIENFVGKGELQEFVSKI